MRLHPVLFAALLCTGLMVVGCAPATGPVEPVLPAPQQERGEAFPGTGNQPLGDTSVPPASRVFAPTNGTSGTATPETTGARDTSALTKGEAAVAMPQGGQANDHSAPLPAATASAPRTP
jgi:hypothetical protein